MQLVVAVTHVAPELEVTVYWVIADPPSIVGAVHEISDALFPFEAAVTEVGAPGFPAVVAETDEVAEEVPIAFLATTVNV